MHPPKPKLLSDRLSVIVVTNNGTAVELVIAENYCLRNNAKNIYTYPG